MNEYIIIYDFDGVICDSVDIKTSAFLELYNNQNLEIQNKIVEYHLKNGGISRLKKIEYYEENLLNNKTDPIRIAELASKFSSIVKEKVINSKYIYGAKKFIIQNSEHNLQYICSGTPNDEMIQIAKEKGIDKYFIKIFGSPRKKITIIKEILNSNKKRKVIYFGDSLTDLLAVNNFSKILFIGIKNKHTNFPENTFLISNFGDKKLKSLNL